MKYIIYILCSIIFSSVAYANTANQIFERDIEQSSRDGSVLIYYCNNNETSSDLKKILHEKMKALSNSSNELETAKSIGCVVASDNPIAEYSGSELYDGPYVNDGMSWYTAEVIESQPETTGFNFPAIVRIPNRKNAGSVAHPAIHVEKSWKVDEDFYNMYFTREIDAANPDDVGYFTCESQQDLFKITKSAKNIAISKRNHFITTKLKASGCRERRGKLHDIKAVAVTQGDTVKWYQITAMEGRSQVAAMLWMWN